MFNFMADSAKKGIMYGSILVKWEGNTHPPSSYVERRIRSLYTRVVQPSDSLTVIAIHEFKDGQDYENFTAHSFKVKEV